jgi:hypothetical protein
MMDHGNVTLINPKSEIRNPKQIQNYKFEFSKLFLGFWTLLFRNCLEFRILSLVLE